MKIPHRPKDYEGTVWEGALPEGTMTMEEWFEAFEKELREKLAWHIDQMDNREIKLLNEILEKISEV